MRELSLCPKTRFDSCRLAFLWRKCHAWAPYYSELVLVHWRCRLWVIITLNDQVVDTNAVTYYPIKVDWRSIKVVALLQVCKTLITHLHGVLARLIIRHAVFWIHWLLINLLTENSRRDAQLGHPFYYICSRSFVWWISSKERGFTLLGSILVSRFKFMDELVARAALKLRGNLSLSVLVGYHFLDC